MPKRLLGVTVGLVLAVAAALWIAAHRIDSSLNDLRQQAATAGHLPFTLRSLDPTQTTAATLFEPVSTPETYTAGAALDGKLYLAGPGGLTVSNGSGRTFLRTGIELPPAPIVALVTGHLRGEPSTTLIAATHGEGLLLLRSGAPLALRQLRPADPRYRDITAILPLSSGDLLLGTRRSGLLLYDGSNLRLFNDALADTPITALAGNEGDLWIGTRTHGLLRWHAGDLSSFTEGLPDLQINALTLSPDGELFVATPFGVAEIVNGRIARILNPGLFAASLALDGNTLLIATLDQGLHELPIAGRASHPSLIHTALSIASTNRQIGSFFTAGPTVFAIGNGAVLTRDRSAWQTVVSAAPQSLADRNISALSFAPDGKLWIGYFDRGLDILDLATRHARHLEDDRLFCINRIVPDPQRGTLDVATANGLVLFDAERANPRQVLTRRDGLIADQVTDIAFTRSGMALATPAGVTFFTAAGAQSLYAFQGLVNNHVYTLAAQPASDRLLAGTLGGISLLDSQTVVQNITLKNSALHRNWITALTRIDTPNTPPTWFVGTYGGGVVQMDAAGRVSPMPTPAPAAVINPNALLATPQHVFAGSLDDGLLVYNIATQHWSQITNGLPSRNVTAFALRDGTLYIGTDNGLVRLSEAKLP